jgi:plastocyanin
MAEKGFGVKEVNLIGASGTPTITSPNNLNLNANNVAISTNVSIGGTLSVTGNVSVGGTLTYEDVTNIDSVGIVTARDGVVVVGRGVSIAAGGLNVTAGVGTFGGGINVSSGTLDVATQIRKSSGTLDYLSATHTFSNVAGSTEYFRFASSGQLGIAGANYGSSGQVLTSGGSGSAASWSDVSVTPTDSDIQVVYTVTANGSSAYRFAGNGVVSTADDPDLYLIRGQKYRFINNSGGSHPFQIRESSGGSAYSTGVTNNGAASGNIDFAPTFDSPAQLVYQCISHGGMVGNIYLRDAAGGNTNVGVTTFSQTVSSVAGVTVTSQGLDHYEEGTFTPFISASSSAPSVTYSGSERGGKYTRIGNIVFYSLGFQMTAYSGGSGNVYIGGFPYVGSGNPGWDGAHVFRDCSAIGLNSRTNQLGAWMETTTVSGYPILWIQVHSNTASFDASTLGASSVQAGRITVHGHYKVG